MLHMYKADTYARFKKNYQIYFTDAPYKAGTYQDTHSRVSATKKAV